ncbi:MAG TPA: cytochrome b/b6 domain-containing protein [Candidatus Cybelea sp.]|nr:cytochrome b/b6 domain-containing protein [Candidatus Cybelea sp.]
MLARDLGHSNRSAWTAVSVALLMLSAFFCFPALARRQERPAQPLKQDEACLACHGQADMKSEKGAAISIRPEKHAASVHGILGCQDCHTAIKEFPHPAKISKVQCSSCHAEQAAVAAKSIHGVLGEAACTSCHGNVHEIAAAAKVQPAKCADCHAPEINEFAQSVHGRAAQAGDPDAPICTSCHGPVHKILASSVPASSVAKKNQPAACARCHADAGFVSRHKIPVRHPVEQYLQSVHGRAVLAGKDAATCSDCHGSHGILPARDTRSRVSHWNVAETCGNCHQEIARTFLESVHGQAIKSGVQDTPDCTDCHGEHLILEPHNPASPVNAAHVSVDTCGRCHGDARLTRRYDLPDDRVPSYAESFHGLAKREGSLTAANCASCHGIHNIFPSNDPRSTVNAANLAKTCGQCHTGVNEKFAIGPVHVQTASGPAHPVVKWIRGVYWLLIPLTLGFMVFHNLLDLFAKAKRRGVLGDSGQQVVRMNLWLRIAHWGVMLSFPTLVFTGFALKYPDSWWSAPFLLWGKHEAFRGELHRTAAVVLIAATLYHFVHLAANRRDRVFLQAMLPKFKDVTDLIGVLLNNLGLRKEEPQFAKFNYAEKLEYWAFLWGTAVMGLSGFFLWFNSFTLRHFPKWITDAATAVHWYEAVLATFSILLWHFYLVIFDPLVYPMDTAWLDGKISASHYRHSRPEYLRSLERAGLVVPPVESPSPDSPPSAADAPPEK